MGSLWVCAVPLAVVLATVLFTLLRGRRRAGDRHAKPTERSALVLLEGNVWGACTVDGVHEPWARYTTEQVRGFCGVVPGRHRIGTTTEAGAATLDFVVYPGEILAFRLDGARARWEPNEVDADTRSMLDTGPETRPSAQAMTTRAKTPGWLVHLRTTMNLVRSRPGAPPAKAAEDVVGKVRRELSRLVASAEARGSIEVFARVFARAEALGELLVGRALDERAMHALVSPVREASMRLAARGDYDGAVKLLELGLAILPGAPELMMLAGCAFAARGQSDEALRALGAALERERGLTAADVARAMRVRMDVRARLGRTPTSARA